MTVGETWMPSGGQTGLPALLAPMLDPKILGPYGTKK